MNNSRNKRKILATQIPMKNWGGVNSRDTDNIDEQFKKQTKNISNTDPHEKLERGELKRHRQHR
jgi:hypothetical protein